MRVIGITGNIGSGKTKIAQLFERYGCKIIEMDKIGHSLYQRPYYRKKVIDIFGKFILNDNKEIERERLRKIVFSHPECLESLNKIVYPALRKELTKILNRCRKDRIEIVVVDAALIFEMKIDDLFDTIITVYANKLISFFRLLKARNINYFEFINIYNSQMPVKEKIKRADIVINNNLPWNLNKKNIEKRVLKIIGKI